MQKAYAQVGGVKMDIAVGIVGRILRRRKQQESILPKLMGRYIQKAPKPHRLVYTIWRRDTDDSSNL